MVFRIYVRLKYSGKVLDTGEVFKTRAEAETFTGIEGTQMENLNVKEWIIREEVD